MTVLIAAAISSSALARDTSLNVDLRQALDTQEFKTALGDDVAFFLRADKPAAIENRSAPFFINSSTGRGMPDEKTCLNMTLRALVAMRNRARQEGGNAIVDLVSFYQEHETGDGSMIDCHAGSYVRARVTLKGSVAHIAK